MVINAYKIEMKKEILGETVNIEKNPKNIIKEVINILITKYIKIVEQGKEDITKTKILEILSNEYSFVDENEKKKITVEVLDAIYGYGILQKYITDKVTSDIRVVAYDKIFIKQKGKWIKCDEKFNSNKEFEEYIRFCALKNNYNINYETPIGVFSDRKNSLRIEAGIEPANVLSPSLVIRIHRTDMNTSLESLFIKYGVLDKYSYKVLKSNMRKLPNIILCGKGGSGKTTLLKALINELPEEIAITTNEETAELYLKNRNVIQRECILTRTENKNIDLEKLSRHSLVMSNDVIVIGELKGAEANSFFDAISTGHMGMATIHADSPINTVDRIITLIKKDIKAQHYSEDFLRRFLVSSIDYIVYMQDFKVKNISVLEYDDVKKRLKVKNIYCLKEDNYE